MQLVRSGSGGGGGGGLALLQTDPNSGADDEARAEQAHEGRRRAPDHALDYQREYHLQVHHVGRASGLLPLQALGKQELEHEARYTDNE